MEVSDQLQGPAALPPEKEPLVRIGQEAWWVPGLVWMLWGKEKFLAAAGNRTAAIKSVVRRYTDWAIPALSKIYMRMCVYNFPVSIYQFPVCYCGLIRKHQNILSSLLYIIPSTPDSQGCCCDCFYSLWTRFESSLLSLLITRVNSTSC
jgi:hypothetical protein